MTEQNHYQLLSINPDASRSAIRTAYRKALRRYHPDANAGTRDGEQMLCRVITAGRILCNPQQRARYDEQLHKPTAHQQTKRPPAKEPAELAGSNQLILLCQKILNSGQLACKRFFGTEQAAATENRAAHQRKRSEPDFNVYLHREINRNQPRRYQRESDGICRKVAQPSRKSRLKNWRGKLSPDC